MRILQISSAKTFGGGERHLVDLCRELTQRGHEVFVALRPTNEWQERLDFLPPERFFYVSIRNSFGMFSAGRLGRFVNQQKIDIVHAHVARDYLAASVAARSVQNARLVLTRHVVFPLKPFHKFALRNVAAAIAVSSAVKGQLDRIFAPEKVHLISNGIIFKPPADRKAEGTEFRELHAIPNDALVVSTLGELKLLKGQRDFVLAANEVVKDFPETYFIVAGKDHTLDQRFRRELKRLAKVFGMADRFLWLDWLDEISPLLSATDIFVSASHSESFGLAMLDAMAAGTPVIATETDGAKELISDKRALVRIKDPLNLAETICHYLGDERARRELADLLRDNAREKYGLERMVDETEALYQEIRGLGQNPERQ